MKRPSFQFYPADWKNNSKLRRCSDAARGAWVDVLCLLHDSDEYGVCRWPLAELAQSACVPLKLVKELVAKDVLKGADKGVTPYVYTPRHAGKDGTPVVLIEASSGPCWYSSRLVRDEYVRQNRGKATRFGQDDEPKDAPKQEPKLEPKPEPKGGIGGESGDGSTSSSTSTSTLNTKDSTPPDQIPPPGLAPSPPAGGTETIDLDGIATDDKAIAFSIGVPALVALGVDIKGARAMVGKVVKEIGETAAADVCGRLAAFQAQNERHPNPIALMMQMASDHRDAVLQSLQSRRGLHVRKLADGRYKDGRTNTYFDCEGRQEVAA